MDDATRLRKDPVLFDNRYNLCSPTGSPQYPEWDATHESRNRELDAPHNRELGSILACSKLPTQYLILKGKAELSPLELPPSG